MARLFDSRGNHIANVEAGRLYTTGGANIGRVIEPFGIYVDINGSYLGEVLAGNRLVSNRASGYQTTNFGNTGSTESIADAGSPGNYGTFGLPGGYQDIDPSRLR